MTPRHMALVANAFARGEVRAPLLFGLLSDQVLFSECCRIAMILTRVMPEPKQ